MPTWFPIAGLLVGILTLAFFMYLVDQGKDKASFASVVVLSLGTALSLSFIGGSAAAAGRVPLARKSPLTFTVAGGIAVFVITFVVSWFTFFERDAKATPVKDVAKEVAKDASISEEFIWRAATTVPLDMAVDQLKKARNVSVDYSECPTDFGHTPVDEGTHKGNTPKEYLENLQYRFANSIGIKYTVEPTGQGLRYVIVCTTKPR